MTSVPLPLTVLELANLASFEVTKEQVTWSRVSMTSDTHVCVQQSKALENKTEHKKQLLILELKNNGISKRTCQVAVDSAAVSPHDEAGKFMIACRTEDIISVAEMGKSAVIANCRLRHVQYWAWISSSVIGLVTDYEVYHWRVCTEKRPVKVFKRHHRLAFSEIISYKCNSNCKWLALIGLEPQADYVGGVVQLYSVDSNITQCITAQTVTFATYTFEGNRQPSTVLCIAARECDTVANGKVHVVELGPHQKGNFALCYYNDYIQFTDSEENHTFDFPIALQVSITYGLIYVFSKYGQIHVCDIESAVCLFSTQLSTGIVFATALNRVTQGVLAVSRTGQILKVNIDTENLVRYVRECSRKYGQADKIQKRLAKRNCISGESIV